MAKKQQYVQYSKRLATWVTVIWFVMSASVIAAAIIRPEIAQYMVSFAEGINGVEIMNMCLYTGNSVGEKGILGFFGSKKDKETADDEDAG